MANRRLSASILQAASRPLLQCRRYTAVSPPSPLRILFCGSDHFSATSLKVLHREHEKNKAFVESIDVVCREDKRAGRGLKTLREVPIKDVARSLNLPIHNINSFKGWNFPKKSNINLIIAVSFGKLIPERLIQQAEHGGLNVHPSLLPMYRGAAPIYHTLLNSTPITGVTVQTLHPTLHDHGTILLQTDPPIPVPANTAYQTLHDALALHGAEMLIETCRRRLFTPPISPVKNNYPESVAPKIDSKEARIDWKTNTAQRIVQIAGILNTAWARLAEIEEIELSRRRRVILSDVHLFEHPKLNSGEYDELPPGHFEYVKMKSYEKDGGDGGGGGADEVLAAKCFGGGWIRIGAIKVEGKPNTHGGEWARSMVKGRGPRMRFV